ncbi:MAG: PAS domain-containing protein [Gemmatimonadota bacterium]|nr:PAS domain-containing protein [Gemmatimonadota bacterium]
MANPIEAQVSPLFRAVLETVAEGVVVFDPDGRLVYSNARARRALAALGDDAVRADAVLPELARAAAGLPPFGLTVPSFARWCTSHRARMAIAIRSRNGSARRSSLRWNRRAGS